MQDKNTTLSTFSQLFKPILSNNIWSEIKQAIPNLDKGIKKLTAQGLVLLIAHAQLQEYGALREISGSVKNEDFSHELRLESISASTISRRMRELPPWVAGQLLKNGIHSIGLSKGLSTVAQKLGNLNLIDSSTITLCISRYRWAEFRKTKGGVKLHLRLKFDGDAYPDKAVMTPAKTADRKLLDELIVDEDDAINVFDRGYVDYRKFDEYCEKGIRFVSRLKENAIIEIVGERPVEEDSPIEEDIDVILGTNARRMKNKLRLITVYDSENKPVTIVTNVCDLSKEEIADIYRYRWQIELFFKWLKQHVQIKHFYGLSNTAVINQLLIALLTYCLMLLLKIVIDYKGDLLKIQREIRACLFEAYQEFLRKFLAKYGRSTRGRRRLKNATIFVATKLQVLSGNTELLNSTDYDPLIL